MYSIYFLIFQRRLFNAAKKAVARMPLRQIKTGDPVISFPYPINLLVFFFISDHFSLEELFSLCNLNACSRKSRANGILVQYA